MESVGEIIERLASVDVGVKCAGCGAILTLIGKQYTIRCHQCGINITLNPDYLARLKQLEHRAKHGEELEERPKCNICRDTGTVILKEQVDDQIYTFAYRCLCNAGQKNSAAWPVVPAAKVVAFVPRLRLADAESHEEKEKAAGAGYF